MKKITIAILIILCLLMGLVSAYAVQTLSFQVAGTGRLGSAFQLLNATHRISILEKDKAHAITPAQASKILGIVKPLRSKPKLTASQASSTLSRLNQVLTPAQTKAADALMARQTQQTTRKLGGVKPGTSTFIIRSQSGNGAVTTTTTTMSGGKGSSGGRVFVPAGGGAVIMTQNGSSVASLEFNPFYTKPSPTGLPSAVMVKNMDAFFALLEHRAKSK